ncbi:putative cobaltochelatase [Desulfohalobiaceae bacterium Ax17]|uniref:putative cobaltochelatase n=1 Tax=Desulfovulcanus ferrireducens TaxID=2831190 RepID=UPI00207BBCC9|nr:putative cobaltochelatase [Desulfovulcanus ferrireducens]MBT8763231.1 putative cobaltochelatase [Desulfovulcanus ferrireducens]
MQVKTSYAANTSFSGVRVGWETRPVYPFPAIVGQEQMKEALLLNAVCPSIGGVLIRGEKGTAKSTAVRALANLLPEIEVVADCPFGCDPNGELCFLCRTKLQQGQALPVKRRKIKLVDLPLGATEERITGTINLEEAVKSGKKAFEPGLLAAAHRGILYIDEVNLLHDHIVDIILDASAMGMNIVEREGISLVHPSEFILIGTMNPEEGELRPQLLDRFGLSVEVCAPSEPEPRMRVLQLREQFDQDPELFVKKFFSEQEDLTRRILKARRLLPRVRMSQKLLQLCSSLCLEAFVAGHRADITLRKTARALAALQERDNVLEDDVLKAAELTLLHRRRVNSPSPPPSRHEHDHERKHEQESSEDRTEHHEHKQRSAENQKMPDTPEEATPEQNDSHEDQSPAGPGVETIFPVGAPFRAKPFLMKRDRSFRKGSGRRSRTRTTHKMGRYVKSNLNQNPQDLALDATLRAAAPYQAKRSREGVSVVIEKCDLRQKVREKRIGNLIVFVVDASGSMGAGKRMVETKGAVLSLLLDAYQKRDKVSFVAFRGKEAEVLLPPTNSIELAYKLLEELPTGGKTPLSQGIAVGYHVLDVQLRKDPNTYPLMVLVSDGKANVSLSGRKPLEEVMELATIIRNDNRIRSVVIDVEKSGLITFGLAKEIALKLGAQYFKIEDLKAATLVDVLKEDVLGI